MFTLSGDPTRRDTLLVPPVLGNVQNGDDYGQDKTANNFCTLCYLIGYCFRQAARRANK